MLYLIQDVVYIDLYHVTPWRNAKIIETVGLKANKSKTALHEVWFCEKAMIDWTIGHLAVHHGVLDVDMVVFSLLLPKDSISYRGKGCYLCHHDIPSWLLKMVAAP